MTHQHTTQKPRLAMRRAAARLVAYARHLRTAFPGTVPDRLQSLLPIMCDAWGWRQFCWTIDPEEWDIDLSQTYTLYAQTAERFGAPVTALYEGRHSLVEVQALWAKDKQSPGVVSENLIHHADRWASDHGKLADVVGRFGAWMNAQSMTRDFSYETARAAARPPGAVFQVARIADLFWGEDFPARLEELFDRVGERAEGDLSRLFEFLRAEQASAEDAARRSEIERALWQILCAQGAWLHDENPWQFQDPVARPDELDIDFSPEFMKHVLAEAHALRDTLPPTTIPRRVVQERGTLSPMEAICWHMMEHAGACTQAEIARSLGLDPAALRKHLARAREKVTRRGVRGSVQATPKAHEKHDSPVGGHQPGVPDETGRQT